MAFSTTSVGNDVTVVRVEGQLIVGNRQELKAVVDQALEQGARKLVIDCTDTGYIDSSGLGALVTMARKAREHGGELRLAGLNDDLRSLFSLTKLDTLFVIGTSVDEMLEGFRAGR